MDLHLPVMNGIEAIERIMAIRPTPILVYSGFVDGDDRGNAAAALAAGAVDILTKPASDQPGKLEEQAAALRRQVRVASRVKVITHPRGRLGGGTAARPVSTQRLAPSSKRTPVEPVVAGLEDAGREVRVIAIGASTGGPQALATLLAQLPADLQAAVVVVQHMADGFIEGLATWLNGICALPVAVGQSGRRMSPGSVTVAPSGLNLVVHDHLRVTTHEPPASQYHVPGIDVTLASVADAYGPEAIGVVLTGMGRDGALGLKRMRDRGAVTIAQDEETSAVYGMPAAAMALGAVDHQLPLAEIGPALIEIACGQREARS
jgi:two-component system chemotaxis response regulator CheB